VTRDGARVPVPWTCDPAGAHGFSSAPTAQPWLPVPVDGWAALSVAAQSGRPESTLELCRRALALRRRLHAEGRLSPDDATAVVVRGEGLLLADRGHLRLVVNLGEVPEVLPTGEVLLTSGPLDGQDQLPPDTAAWLGGS
jgi:alpha-glucosidase